MASKLNQSGCSKISNSANNKPHLNDVIQLTQRLSIEDKAKLFEWLLSKQSGLNAIPGSSLLIERVILLINMMSCEGLSKLLKAIANRLAREETQHRQS